MRAGLVRCFLTVLSVCLTYPTLSVADELDSLYHAARIHLENGDPATAATLFRQIVRNDTTRADAWIGLGETAVAQNQTDSARALFALAEQLSPQSGYALYGDGVLAVAAADTQNARTHLERAVDQNGDFADARVLLARLRPPGFRERFNAIRSLNQATESAPRHPSAYFEMGYIRELDGDTEGAIEKYEEQLRHNPRHPRTLQHIGYCLLEAGRSWHARQRLYEALAVSQGHDGEITAAIAVTYMNERDFQLAHDTFLQAMRSMTQRSEIHTKALTRLRLPRKKPSWIHWKAVNAWCSSSGSGINVTPHRLPI